MTGARARRTRSVVVALFTAFLLALSLPALALAGGEPVEAPGDRGQGDSETQTDIIGQGGGLARTGFDAWKIGAAGLICIGASLVLIRSTAPARRPR